MPRIVVGFLVVVAIMLAVPVLLAWSASRRRLRVGRTDGALVLRMPRGHHAILAALAILPCAAFAGVALAAGWAPGAGWNGRVLAAFTGLLGAATGGYLLALELRGRLRVDDASIEKIGALTRHTFAWDEVARLSFNPVNHWFFLTMAGGRRVYVLEGLDGIADFAELALRRLPPEVLAGSPDAADALRELAAS